MIKEEQYELQAKYKFYLKVAITQFTILIISFVGSIVMANKYLQERKNKTALEYRLQSCKSKNKGLFDFCKNKCFLLQKETLKQCRKIKETKCSKVMEKYGTELVPQHMKRRIK